MGDLIISFKWTYGFGVGVKKSSNEKYSCAPPAEQKLFEKTSSKMF